MKKINLGVCFGIIITCICLFLETSYAATYYVSNSGKDNKPGDKEQTAWKTIGKVNSFVFSDGDTVLFKRGDTFSDTTLEIKNVENLTIGDYGEGEKPLFDGNKIMPILITDSKNITIKNINISGQEWQIYKASNILVENVEGLFIDGVFGNGHPINNRNSKGKTAISIQNCSGVIEIKNCEIFNWGPYDLPKPDTDDCMGIALMNMESGEYKIHGNKIYNINADGIHVYLTKANGAIFDNILYNAGADAIGIKGSENCEIYENEFYRTAEFLGEGGSGSEGLPAYINLHQVGERFSINNTISANSFKGGDGVAIKLGSAQDTKISENMFSNVKSALYIQDLVKNTMFHHNIIENPQSRITPVNIDAGCIYENNSDTGTQIFNNTLYNGKGNCKHLIALANSNKTTISKNIVYQNDSSEDAFGLYYNPAASDPVISNNYWYNPGKINRTKYSSKIYTANMQEEWNQKNPGDKFDNPLMNDPEEGDYSLYETSLNLGALGAVYNETDAPVAATDAPVAATDAPVAATDAPVAATDAPVAATDAPVAATDDIVAATDDIVAATDDTTVITEDSVTPTDDTTVVTDDTVTPTDDTTVVTDDTVTPTDDTTVVTDDTVTPTDDTTVVTEETSFANEYYVSPSGDDSALGTKEKPYATLSRAIQEAKANDVVFIMGGEYYFDKKLEIATPGPIIFKAFESQKPVFIYKGEDTYAVGIQEKATFITLEGITFIWASNTNGNIIGTGAKNTTIRGCTIFFDKEMNPEKYDGIKILKGADNTAILNCTIHGAPNQGIDTVGADNLVIRGNTIFDCQNAIVLKGGSDNNLIEENHVFNLKYGAIGLGGTTSEQFIDYQYENTGSIVRNNLIRYEEVYKNDIGGGIFLWGAKDCKVYNNTLIGPGIHIRNGGDLTNISIVSRDNFIANNVIWRTGNDGLLVVDEGNEQGLTMMNNLYWKTTGSGEFKISGQWLSYDQFISQFTFSEGSLFDDPLIIETISGTLKYASDSPVFGNGAPIQDDQDSSGFTENSINIGALLETVQHEYEH